MQAWAIIVLAKDFEPVVAQYELYRVQAGMCPGKVYTNSEVTGMPTNCKIQSQCQVQQRQPCSLLEDGYDAFEGIHKIIHF